MKAVVFSLLMLIAAPLSATTYYVDNTNGSASDSNAGTNPALPWLTIGKCVTKPLVAGDICQVQTGGTYDVRVTSTLDGTSGSRIIFQAQAGSPRPKVRGFSLTGADYVTLTGFEITTSGMSADSTSAIDVTNTHTGVWVIDNYVHDTTTPACIRLGNGSFDIVRNNTINYCGTSTYAGGGAPAITTPASQSSTDVLIEGNTISYVSDYLNPFGARWVYRNNTLGPADPATPASIHIDGMQNNGIVTDSLMEGNKHGNNQNSDNHFYLNQINGADGWIIRYNWTSGSKGGLDWRNADYQSFYNNTFYDNRTAGNTNNFQILLTSSTGNLSRNNIWYNSSSSNPYSGSGVDKDYDLYCCGQGSPAETHQVNSDPLFANAAGEDFHLSAGSPALTAGSYLTTVDVADTGSGTSLIVVNARPFQPGWAGTTPDSIAVGTVGNTVAISSIDYATNTITLASGISRNDGDSVWLKAKSDGVNVLPGAAPYIGAFGAASTLALTSISPASGNQGQTVAVTLTGVAFDAGGATVNISGTGITQSALTVVNSTTITVNFIIAGGATVSTRTVSVTTVDGTSNTQNFQVLASGVPTLTSISPASGYISSTVNVTLTGTNLNSGNASVSVSGSGVTVSGLVVGGATSITCQFNIAANAAKTVRTVTVTTDTGTSNSVNFSVYGLGGAGRGKLLSRGGH